MDLNDSLFIAAAGMRAQGERLRVISENLANADSVGERQGADRLGKEPVITDRHAQASDLGLDHRE